MIDRLYIALLVLVLGAIGQIYAFTAVVFLVFVALLAAIPLLLFEGLATRLAPRLQRDLLTFRYQPGRGITRLVRHLGLDQPQLPEALAEKAKALAEAAVAVSLRHPNAVCGPIRRTKLTKALAPAIHPANAAFAKALRKSWPAPKPGFSLGGLVLRLRAAIGRLLFGRWLEVARARTIQGTGSVVAGLGQPKPEEPWQTHDFPDVMTFFTWNRLSEVNDLPLFDAGPALLPLGDQRLLAATTAQLHGTQSEAWRARLLNPTHFRELKKLAADRAKWETWKESHAKSETAKAAERTDRMADRMPDSLTPDEITALVAGHAQDSILLNRLWPPGATVTTNSWLGGLPCLPPEMAWPRNTETGLPQHFLAQVDCADLPTLGGTSPLPREGLLLFFSDLDEERLSDSHAVVHVPKDRQSVPPRALPDDLPEIDHSGGKPNSYNNAPGQRNYPKWPVVPTAVKIWAGDDTSLPQANRPDYRERARAAHDASLAAVMPPPAKSTSLGTIFPSHQRKDAEGKTILTPEGKAIPYTVFDPSALPEGFPFCGAGIDAFVTRLQQQATKAARRAASDRSLIDAKWNDTEEKRARKRAEADQADNDARAAATLATQARDALGTLPALSPVPPDRIAQMQRWLAGLAEPPRSLTRDIQSAVSGSLLDLARASVTDPALAACLPASVFSAHLTSLLPSPSHSQHLMLGPAQTTTNSTALSGIRLLCLDSDYGPGMMYCDCGVIEYWIAPEDLAALRFDRVEAETAGG